MKKFFTLVFATMLAGNMMAQMHGALTFCWCFNHERVDSEY